ncbi:HET-domain-containing protein [Hypoxylon sp. FL0890]|nr:HET-domain-containing protein [Hypoxylon sp. FL0890]
MALDPTKPHEYLQLYESLVSDDAIQIRLFDLEPNELKTSNFTYPDEPFEALSYSWGTEWSAQNVIVNGITVPVKKCLETVLRRRRDTTNLGTLWIDAICINQEDDEEKSQQVPLMAMIYAAPRAVTMAGSGRR